MEEYHRIVRDILEKGEWKANRTGTRALTIAGMKFEHDMAKGYPLLTTKKVPFRLIASELEFFIRGITDKKWLQERNNRIWDEWCNPGKVPYGHDPETQKRMLEEPDLGAIYGFQWRHFGAAYKDQHADYSHQGVDQLREVVKKLKEHPNDRRMLVSAWNPMSLHEMALPPCHYGFQVVVIGDKLNVLWNQRSVDTMLGLPFNIASYGLLLHLLALESGMKEGKLVGFLGDVHIYENHRDGARELLGRDCRAYPLPRIRTSNFSSIFDWKYPDTELLGYQSYPSIKMDIAV
ncbi:TPA: thymidylate synthase [Candidatus Woesearchaeota archaeon]|nr:thymidylate synthase [Candidatus Woesearchaeota archaeon]QBM01064.1 thymidylate synthase [uncultured archaeon]HIH91761.1 thymidylate synthase [Candidatus Woesearchaeota archaeon]HIJ19002.1 thymidylate synthase [Candidatus Woesearchaeota archaeon]